VYRRLASVADRARPEVLRAEASTRADVERVVNMLDACDPTTFNAVIGDGACVREGGVTFSDFIAQLEAHGTAPAWRFAASNVEVREGDALNVINRGGEVHTFTEVAHFGGGFVAELNGVSGNPVPAPECLAIGSLVFVPPGGTQSVPVDEAGDENYQCCLHPWMRAVVHARAH
jgi:hypothetical protein